MDPIVSILNAQDVPAIVAGLGSPHTLKSISCRKDSSCQKLLIQSCVLGREDISLAEEFLDANQVDPSLKDRSSIFQSLIKVAGHRGVREAPELGLVMQRTTLEPMDNGIFYQAILTKSRIGQDVLRSTQRK